MLERLTQLTLDQLIWLVIGPMALLQILMVGFYVIWTLRIWPHMPRREAILHAPLAIPISFSGFFAVLKVIAGGRPLIDFAGILALLAVATWLPGILVGALTYHIVTGRRSAVTPTRSD